MSQFKVGDAVVICNAERFPTMNGMEVTITEIGVPCTDYMGNPFVGYGINIYTPLGARAYAKEYQLKRKSPPASTADEREYEALMDRLMNRKEQAA